MISNIDELFEREELSAAPDPGWPDCFNSGVFVFRPSLETYDKLLEYSTEHGSFDGKSRSSETGLHLGEFIGSDGKNMSRNNKVSILAGS